MNLYLLIPINVYEYNSPWFPTKGTVSEMVVQAKDEKQARQIASDNGGTENNHRWKPWKNKKWSQCIKLKTKAQVISLTFSD